MNEIIITVIFAVVVFVIVRQKRKTEKLLEEQQKVLNAYKWMAQDTIDRLREILADKVSNRKGR